MPGTLTIPQNDYGKAILFKVRDALKKPYDLTVYTVKIKVWKLGAPGSLLFAAVTCSKTDPTKGECTFTIVDGNFPTATEYLAELELTKGGVVESTAFFPLVVSESG